MCNGRQSVGSHFSNMIAFQLLAVLLPLSCVSCWILRKDIDYVDPRILLSSPRDDCDPSTIPVMDSFDMKRFSGKWFELAKTYSGYIDVSDGVWLIEGTNASNTFRFSGRDNNQHCIRPLKGKISAASEPPGTLNLKYQTFSTHVDETIRILFTDYVSVAVIYTCMHHVHKEKEACHAAGIFGAIWTRQPHADLEVYERAAQYLEMACVHKTTLLIRNIVGPCRVENIDFRIDDFPAPDYCYQPLDLGSCRGSLRRYYYDPKEKMCKTFNYGGCGGSKNNFMSIPECHKKCIAASSKEPVCMSIAKCGLHCSPCCTEDRNGCVSCDCEHIIVDDFLNCVKSPSLCPNDCQAEHFHSECYVCKCSSEEPSLGNELLHAFCNEVKAEGNCDERLDRYYYNAVNRKCEKFAFSGCNGNNNNFNKLEDCKVKCEVSDRQYVARTPTKIDDDPNGAKPLDIISWTTLILVLLLQNSYIHHIS